MSGRGESLEMPDPQTKQVLFLDAFWVWLKVAIYSFGGPAGQISVMHKILVEEKRWIDESRFLHALNYCMLLPGPEAQQLATYIGWLLHKSKGALTAGILFIIPGFMSILALSILYAGYYELPLVQALFFGLKPGVMALVFYAAIRIGKRALRNHVMVGIAIASFVAIFFLDVPFPFIIVAAGFVGFIGGRKWPNTFDVMLGHGAEDGNEAAISQAASRAERPSLVRAMRILGLGLLIWFGPLLLMSAMFGPDSTFVSTGIFFSQAAVVTFGGAYAVLAYIAQQAVDVFGWLNPHEMLDGLGMAETTPGPLIQVVQYVGYMASFRNPGLMSPMTSGVLGSLIVTWVTFVPCFIWIIMGAPYIEYLRGNKALSTALSAITAAVVGVILNLSVWFSLHNLFDVVNELQLGPLNLQIPLWETFNLAFLLISIGAFVLLFYANRGTLLTLTASTITGALYYLLFI